MRCYVCRRPDTIQEALDLFPTGLSAGFLAAPEFLALAGAQTQCLLTIAVGIRRGTALPARYTGRNHPGQPGARYPTVFMSAHTSYGSVSFIDFTLRPRASAPQSVCVCDFFSKCKCMCVCLRKESMAWHVETREKRNKIKINKFAHHPHRPRAPFLIAAATVDADADDDVDDGAGERCKRGRSSSFFCYSASFTSPRIARFPSERGWRTLVKWNKTLLRERASERANDLASNGHSR